ncbi:hypothetical protein DPMN_099250 [Dreissena polymorpha]|uniref:Uncharacterized protein n=1 Tax=Dreissena polymorpha TaxID=45954 RepID=A0A9D4LDS9_DREPO|nr:hypothetical protein DPMN_099250 [Dreissena polymorpha]
MAPGSHKPYMDRSLCGCLAGYYNAIGTEFAHLKGTNILGVFLNVNARVFTNQMWTDGQRTKTNPKTSPEQSGKLPHPPVSHFHDDWAKNVTSRKNDPPTGRYVFSPIWTIFELVRHINKTNTSRVFTRKTAPPTGGHTFRQNIIGAKLTKFHEERTINVASKVFTNKCGRTDGRTTDKHRKTALSPGNHVFQRTGTIFKLNSRI